MPTLLPRKDSKGPFPLGAGSLGEKGVEELAELSCIRTQGLCFSVLSWDTQWLCENVSE